MVYETEDGTTWYERWGPPPSWKTARTGETYGTVNNGRICPYRVLPPLVLPSVPVELPPLKLDPPSYPRPSRVAQPRTTATRRRLMRFQRER